MSWPDYADADQWEGVALTEADLETFRMAFARYGHRSDAPSLLLTVAQRILAARLAAQPVVAECERCEGSAPLNHPATFILCPDCNEPGSAGHLAAQPVPAPSRTEADLCECDRIDEVDNPHRHDRDAVCEWWATVGRAYFAEFTRATERILRDAQPTEGGV